jgi:hypothetical protein
LFAGTALAGATTAPTAGIQLRFIPYRLGHDTTIEFNARIATPDGRIPPPLTEMDVRYPGSLGLAVGELGLTSCLASKLQAHGLAGCSAESRMGEGSAKVEIAVGPEVLEETGQVAILRAPEQHGHLALLFYATGHDPVFAQIPFYGALLPAPPPYGARIHIDVPLVSSLPGAPYVSVVQMHATLGPLGLTYYERVRGRSIAYKPRGILLPSRCPRGGFRFAATFAFLDGTHAYAHTRIRCPRG